MKRTKGSIIKRILLFVALIGIPWTALVVLSNGKQKFKKLRYWGPMVPIVIDGVETGDSSYYKACNQTFEYTDGTKGSFNDFEDKIIVYFVAGETCPNNCGVGINKFIDVVYEKEIKGTNRYKDLVILTEVVDYENSEAGNPSLLQNRYKEKIDSAQWKFIKVDNPCLYDFVPSPNGPNMLRETSTKVVGGKMYYANALLIDKNRHVRHVESFSFSEVNLLEYVTALKTLKREETLEKTGR